MFIDENDLDDGFGKDREAPKYNRLADTNGAASGIGNLHLGESNDDNDGLPPFRSAGGLGTPSSSRARMLAQQREIQLKKRQNNMLGGMVRSSLDSNVSGSSPMKLPTPTTNSQFTPAVRQFSAPKSVRDTSNDASPEKNSEFSKRGAAHPQQQAPSGNSSSRHNRRFSDGDDDDDDDNDDRRYKRAEQCIMEPQW